MEHSCFGAEDIYSMPAWGLLGPRERKCIISVLEGVVPGTEIHPCLEDEADAGLKIGALEELCMRAGLHYNISSEPGNCLNLCIDMSFDRELLEHSLGNDYSYMADEPIFSRLEGAVPQESLGLVAENVKLGRLYGYPSCCIERYALQNVLHDRGLGPGAYELFIEESKSRMENGIYRLRGVFWRAFLEHVPCSIDCRESAGLARSIYSAVARIDNETSGLLIKEELSSLER